MTSVSSIETVTPHPLPSLPPSPSSEEDLSRVHVWQDDTDPNHLQPSHTAKGKEKQTQEDYRDSGSDEALESSAESSAYPPMSDQIETRQVEENLRRWEIAERKKRKAARESTANPQSLSVVADVSRRASLLWSGRKPKRPSHGGLGNHTVLKSQEFDDVLPMDDIAATPTPSPTPSPTRSTNPFLNSSDAVSPFADPTPVMEPSSVPPTSLPGEDSNAEVTASSQRPALLTASSSFRRPPTPKPLNIPPPRTPPPPIPGARSSPVLSPPPVEPEEEPKETRWWHEWLCGCGEDRGVDNQAGRTNPFE